MTLGTKTWSYNDCSNEFNTSATYYDTLHTLDPNYTAISAHQPASAAAAFNTNLINSPGNAGNGWIWAYSDEWHMELASQIGDPLKDVWVQERFNNIPTAFTTGQPTNFSWNGSPTPPLFWTSGEAKDPAKSGYLYQANFVDYIEFNDFYYPNGTGLPRTGGIPVLQFVHSYYAATKDITNGGPGIPVGTFTANAFTDGTTHA